MKYVKYALYIHTDSITDYSGEDVPKSK